MTTIIILTGIAIFALVIGFFEIQLPFIGKKPGANSKEKEVIKDSSKTIEAFYRALRAESWMFNTQNRKESDLASSESFAKTA